MKIVKGKKAEQEYQENVKSVEECYGSKIDNIKDVPKLKKNKVGYYQKPDQKEALDNLEELLEREIEMEEEFTDEVKQKLIHRKNEMEVKEIVCNDCKEWIDKMKQNIDKDLIKSNNPVNRMLGYNYVENNIAYQVNVDLIAVRDFFSSKHKKSDTDAKICEILKIQSADDMVDKIKEVVKE